MKDIFDSCQLGNLKLNSRIIRTGLWESEYTDNGRLTNDIYTRYENIAKSGVGLITTELIGMYPKDVFTKYTHNIYSLDFNYDFNRLTALVHKYNVPILAQLGFVNFNSGIDMNIDVNNLTHEDIRKIQTDIIIYAKKLAFAGFDGIQLALGNNFFLSKFINPYFNQRCDDYGGDTFNRMRIILETIKVIKDNFDLHINCRINAYDGRKGGTDKNESMRMCQLLEEYNADSLQITKPLSPTYFTKEQVSNDLIDYCQKLSKNMDIPVIIGGGFNDKNQINNILNSYDVDYISMYRPFVAQHDFLSEWKDNKNIISRCKMCNNCYRQKTSTCYHFS